MSKKLPTRVMSERYGVCVRTLERWTAAGILPPPIIINKRKYWDEEELVQREREGMRRRSAS